MIRFNVPCVVGNEHERIREVIAAGRFSGDGDFTKRSERILEKKLGAHRVLLTTSCTHALEMAALLLDIAPGDEVIMPSFTFVSTANAFALRGARIVFVDVAPETMNLDPKRVEAAVTPRTKAIVPVHYAGVSCDMERLDAIAKRAGTFLVEDAAQCISASYKDRPLGTIGDLGCLSFHETKNLHCGEGGALVINNAKLVERAEIIREKGTNRSRFLRGQVDKYTWVDVGSSYVPGELSAAFLFAQLEQADQILERRMALWQRYHSAFGNLPGFEVPRPPSDSAHNGHIYWLKASELATRQSLIEYLKAAGIEATFHYVPLHSSDVGARLGRFDGDDRFTSPGADGLVRLPMYDSLTREDQDKVIETVWRFAGR